LLFNLEGTRLINLGTQPLTGGPAYDCAGYFGSTCGAPNAKWRHVFNTTWATPWSGFDLTARWRFISGTDSEQISPNSQLAGNTLPLTQHIKPCTATLTCRPMWRSTRCSSCKSASTTCSTRILRSSIPAARRLLRIARRSRRMEVLAMAIPSQARSIRWAASSSPV